MQADTIESHGGYTLKGRSEIIETLKLIQKKKCLLSAQPSGKNLSFVTTIVQVMPERELVVMDLSENFGLNQQLLAAQEVVFSGQVEGIQSRFTLAKLTEATLNGQTVLAAPIPDSLYWRQQRKFYRVTIPVAMPAKCVVKLDDMPAEFGIADISLSGLALVDKTNRLNDSFAMGHILEECTLILPGHGEVKLGLEVRNKVAMTWANPPAGQRVGCIFRGTSRNFEISLQKFIYEIELQKKRQESVSR
ncbi:flagellar brake protein [Methylocaldum sp.]|uniref:flagellar brake protein n=1 Tax=Methylocaldum sp. TaxID=1969727 RepID=UPI002D2CB919|nr:flagellar brake protein [Methylocaldum sp.]HYE38033.1 flagellar brake protein [Methylocaldum sp.]